MEEGEEEEEEEGEQEEKAEDELVALEDEGLYCTVLYFDSHDDYGSTGKTKGNRYGSSKDKSKGEGQRTCQ